MITFVVATLAVQGPVMLEPKIVSAIVLKNGLVMLTREAELPAGGGQFRIEKIPTAYDGAFWYGTGALKVSDLKTSLSYSKKTISRPAANLTDLLKANIGKPVQLKVARGTERGFALGHYRRIQWIGIDAAQRRQPSRCELQRYRRS